MVFVFGLQIDFRHNEDLCRSLVDPQHMSGWILSGSVGGFPVAHSRSSLMDLLWSGSFVDLLMSASVQSLHVDLGQSDVIVDVE